MDLSCSPPIEPTGDPRTQKVWAAQLCKPLSISTDSLLSVQLPTGGYELSEYDEIHYALYASGEFSVILRLTEVDHLRTSGDLVINGAWP